MRKQLFGLFIFVCFTALVLSQDFQQTTHQYITREAWQYLIANKQQINWYNTDMASHIGDYEVGDYGEPWATGKVVIGAYKEDESDPIYQYVWPNISSTHFWNADAGDQWMLHVTGWGDYENAYVKALAYTYGNSYNFGNYGHTIYIQHRENPDIAGKVYSINLLDLYNYGTVYYCGYQDYPYNTFHPVNPPVQQTLSLEERKRYAYLILGRLIHLLEDQSVPAHAHGDIHAWPNLDDFEVFMGNNLSLWDWQIIPHQGARNLGPPGIIDVTCMNNPIKYLFYLSNQVADQFPSNNIPGNRNYSSNQNGQDYGLYLDPIYSQLANWHFDPFHSEESWEKIGDFTFCFSIKSVASLLYWFAYYTNQFPQTPPPQNLVLTSNLIGNSLYRGQTANIVPANLGNTSNPCFQWRLYRCSNNDYHNLVYWPLNEAGLQTYSRIDAPNFLMGNSNFNNQDCPTGDVGSHLNFWVQLRVVNGAGSSNWAEFHVVPVNTQSPGGGCPYIFVNSVVNDSTNAFKVENNILHRSEFSDFVNQDIKDLYHIENKVALIDNKISIAIQETEPDHDYFDQVKLYAVDHPFGTVIGITESNQIVMYDTTTVQSTDAATQNSTRDITQLIQYNYQGKKVVEGSVGDSIYAHYDNGSQLKAFKRFKEKYSPKMGPGGYDSLALIGELGHNTDNPIIGNVQKNYAGNVVINTNTDTYSKNFARRELMSTVILPFSSLSDVVNHIDVNWSSDYALTYFSVVPIMYSGFTVTEMPLDNAMHTMLGDVTQNILNQDTIYAELDTTSTITLSFNNVTQGHGTIRDYIFETNGRYSTSNTLNAQNRVNSNGNELNSPLIFKLYLNYPNPFNPNTKIKYDIGKSSNVKITVYNLLGQTVKTLVNQYLNAGSYSVNFDGTNFASGIYFYKLEAGTYTEIKKMVLIK